MNLGKGILIIIFLFIRFVSNAQNLSFTGNVQDGHTKEPVSFASVYLLKSGIGQTSDSAGNFTFSIAHLPSDTLVVSYVGYKLVKIPVNNIKEHSRLIIQLERGLAPNDVFVKVKLNKGLFLWRKIMGKKKQYNRYNLSNFGYEAYNKLEVDFKNFKPQKIKNNFLLKPFSFVLDNIDSTSEKEPFLPAYLLESISDYAYQKKPQKYAENIKATNTKGFTNESISKLLGVMNQNVNIYANFITVMDKDFISPFNENGDNFYIFSVPDTQVIAGKRLFHFVFKPKRSGQNTFEGDAWVIAQTFQIQKISLFLGKDANINFIDRISVFQEFIPINDTVYFLNRDKFFADFRALGKKSLTLIGRKTTSYKNITILSDSLTALFKGQNIEELITTQPGGNKKSDAEWELIRPDTLSVNERAIYTTIDSLLGMQQFKQLRRIMKFAATGYANVGNFLVGPWFNWVSSNQWEGRRYRFDLSTNKGFNKNIFLHSYLAYGNTDKKWKGEVEGYWIINRDPKRSRLHLSYSNDIDRGITHPGDISKDNIFSLAIRKPNTTRKFLQLKEMSLESFNEWGKGFSTEVFLSRRLYTPLQNLPFKNSFPTDKGQPLNNFEIALRLRFAYLEQFIEGDYFRYSLGTTYPVVEISAARGVPGILKSAYAYTKFAVSVRDGIKISPYGTIRYKAFAGKVLGTLPFTLLENHPGNDIYYYDPGTYNLMNRFEYLSDRYGGINIEHNFGSGLFRFIPLTRKLKWRQFWNVKMLWGALSNENNTLNNNGSAFFKTLNGKTYIEAGTGIDNIFKLLRFDFIWLVSPNLENAAKSSRFGIFGSIQFQF
ncbi:MAG: carboxypeptidase-like regulatory protein [Ferruginibacter sp.]|nr:carboxypeptidase-like regulatory protein [Ferruginibacter sp.]